MRGSETHQSINTPDLVDKLAFCDHIRLELIILFDSCCGSSAQCLCDSAEKSLARAREGIGQGKGSYQLLRELFKRRSRKHNLAQAQAEFDATARALVEANRAARARTKKISPEMLLAADQNSAALEKLLHAKHDLEQATGGPEPVELTELVHRKVSRLFSDKDRSEAILLLEKQCGHGLPFCESAAPADWSESIGVLKFPREYR